MTKGWKDRILNRLGLGGGPREDAGPLYAALVAQARNPVFYTRFGVADTIDGRFDMLCLHGFLVLDRLKAEGSAADQLGQALVDALFLDLDRSLREMGVGDVSVGKRMKTMAQAFYGRAAAYREALGSGDMAALAAAVARNVFAGSTDAEDASREIAAYVKDSAASLGACDLTALRAGRPAFAALTGDGSSHEQ